MNRLYLGAIAETSISPRRAKENKYGNKFRENQIYGDRKEKGA